MGELVIGAAASHAPGITAWVEQADPEQVSRFHAGMEKIRQAFTEAKPDVIVEISNDHLRNFYLNNMPAICVGIADSYSGPYEGESLRIGQWRVPGHPDLARALLGEALNAGFDAAFSQELVLGHAEMVPLHFTTPSWDVPVVPIMVNDFVPPLPPLRRIYQLGQLIGKVVASRPKGERVAILGTGGLSHWVGLPEMGRVNPVFDQECLEIAADGRGEVLAEYPTEALYKGGNGMQEFRNWIGVMGALPGVKGEVTAYEPVVPWITGCGAIFWRP